MHPATSAIHGGEDRDHNIGAPASPSIVTATSFHVTPDSIGFSANDGGDLAAAPMFYTRWANPTLKLLEQRLAALEQADAAVSFASGMAAVSALFLWKLKAGDHLLLADVCYAGVAELAADLLPNYGISVSVVDTSDPAAVAAAIRPETRLLHIETPANPTLRLADISVLAELAHARGVELSVDSTIATPVATRPLQHGADYVVHSLTKYMCGHGDAIGGAVLGRADAMASLRGSALVHLGACLHPFAAWLVLRGLETLPARMALHERNAARVAAFLEQHPRVERVWWPGLASHPQHELAQRQMRNFSGLLSFRPRGDGKALINAMAEKARLFSYAVSLGKTRSLMFWTPTDDILRASFRLSGAAGAAAYRTWAGDGLIRMSIGLEDADDLIADLDQAMA